MPAAENGRTGRPRRYPLRVIRNASMYIIRPEVIPKQPGRRTFEALPRRRVVERTFAWPTKYRRLRADCENAVSSPRAWILLAMTSRMARRLRPA